ncbi:MAG: hypothetical protein Harvfovirus43_2 [Harvfovirus sp.]|uniref:Cystatin domain-containing protein n=1 Tax=Harvfovirus sp. TaxID=2487768 RepID=A0A3G5A5Q7_9VIRU|nr:MAG: hypothetical protein Harvfovirus43_2 [Harvfovirus sp.]
MVGGYSEFAAPDEAANKVLTDNYAAVHAVKGLEDLSLETLLTKYRYARQVVAGLNYKFHITATDGKYEVVIWQKLDSTYSFTYAKKLD